MRLKQLEHKGVQVSLDYKLYRSGKTLVNGALASIAIAGGLFLLGGQTSAHASVINGKNNADSALQVKTTNSSAASSTVQNPSAATDSKIPASSKAESSAATKSTGNDVASSSVSSNTSAAGSAGSTAVNSEARQSAVTNKQATSTQSVNNDNAVIHSVPQHIFDDATVSIQTINYVGAGKATPAANVQMISWTDDMDLATHVTTYTPDGNYEAVRSPVVAGYRANRMIVNGSKLGAVTEMPNNSEITVTYTAINHGYTITPIDKNGKLIGKPISKIGVTGQPIATSDFPGYTIVPGQTKVVPNDNGNLNVVYRSNTGKQTNSEAETQPRVKQTAPTAKSQAVKPITTNVSKPVAGQAKQVSKTTSSSQSLSKKLPQTNEFYDDSILEVIGIALLSMVGLLFNSLFSKKRYHE
ncbi:hypothetical protein [Pediococcus damnosus]|uniref:hypothetical protein n=1 Tax=Pediococcus damnosus TaxID=51663 RepID=UPI003F6B5AFF